MRSAHLYPLGGIIILENSLMVEDGEPYNAPRSWPERLFSLPWKPFETMKTIVPKIPRKDILQHEHYYVMHPTVAAELKKEFENVRE